MRCWDCDTIIIIPEIIDGEPGVAGQIRSGTRTKPDFPPRTATQEFSCQRCGTRFMQTTTRMPGRVVVETIATTDAEKERRRGWRG